DRQRAAQELSGGKPVNISIIEQPTPPELDKKKMMKILGGAFAFCVFLGLLLAFLIDFVLDRTLRRPVEVQRRLKEDVFLTIPDIHWDRTSKYPPILRRLANGTNGHLPENGTMAMEKFRPEEALAEHAAGLGERVITYFELNELSMKKPRMVGLAGCHHGAGVSSLASGLAAALSRSIQGNVLLVNLNRATNTAVSFQQGEEGKDLPRFLADRSEGAPDENNGRTHGTNGSGGNGHPGHALAHASHFVQMVPELTASEYDYIVFDMPPITPTSTTPRLSSQMDLMLMVLESEKTRQESGVRARSLLQESKTRVKTILNKYRTYVPAGLSSDAQV
ncbi:MAG TPA: hypothetical protein VHH88_09075, partial [Verrucomicrobiae bacterium]|nr:hypothetical protein [Verrucomicrobiae bacterium]